MEGTSDATTSGTEGASSSETTRSPDTTSDTPTSGVPTSTGNTTNETTTAATATDTTATEPVATTTAATTTTATTIQETDTDTDTDTETDTTGSYGLCGWKPSPANYYACEKDGGIPGMTDPDHPIDCPPGVMEGDACSEISEINNYGCCTPEGVLYYCEITMTHKVIEIDCGM